MAETETSATLAYKPLYLQVKDRLVRRLIDGAWRPGQLIASEFDLAREVGVSQGTIRKALDAMTAENLLVRRQGRGTYVATPEESRILFHYFRLLPDVGEASFPESKIVGWRPERARAKERESLKLAAGENIWRIDRVRALRAKPSIAETIFLPVRRFQDFDAIGPIPNNLYALYSERWGITIGRASERLKAISAGHEDAAQLGCSRATPLLEITRVAYDLENNPVELRVSRCLTRDVHYSSELG